MVLNEEGKWMTLSWGTCAFAVSSFHSFQKAAAVTTYQEYLAELAKGTAVLYCCHFSHSSVSLMLWILSESSETIFSGFGV